MESVKLLGILAFIGGIVLAGFHGIGILMNRAEGFYSHTLVSLFGENNFTWIEDFPIAAFRSGLDFVVGVQIYWLLISIGVLLILIHGLFAKG